MDDNKKYPVLKEKIDILERRTLLSKENIDNLYNDVVKEFEEMGDDPDFAKMNDIMEIADASGYQIPEE